MKKIEDLTLNMIQITRNYILQSEYIAAIDNVITKDEQRQLDKIKKASERYIKELEKI